MRFLSAAAFASYLAFCAALMPRHFSPRILEISAIFSVGLAFWTSGRWSIEKYMKATIARLGLLGSLAFFFFLGLPFLPSAGFAPAFFAGFFFTAGFFAAGFFFAATFDTMPAPPPPRPPAA